jgi:Fusaric acid resistance protein-like
MTASKPGGQGIAGSAGGRRLADLVDRALLTPRDAWRMGRRSAHDRVDRLRARGWFIAQSALGAGLAWFVAGTLLHHVSPFLAPIAALIVLGQSYGHRIRRTLEVVVGVAIGVAVGDLFRIVFGVGWWQVTVVVLVAMVVALLFGAGQLMVTQAAAQAVVVTAIVAPHGPFDRWIDALVGALIALVLTLVAPSKPLREPRRLAAAALREVADILEAAHAAVIAGDQEAAEDALGQARDTGEMLTRLTEAVQEGVAAGSVSLRRARNLGGMSLSMTRRRGGSTIWPARAGSWPSRSSQGRRPLAGPSWKSWPRSWRRSRGRCRCPTPWCARCCAPSWSTCSRSPDSRTIRPET